MKHILFVAFALFTASACSSSTASSSDADPVIDGGAVCNDLVNVGSTVAVVASPGAPPTALGGTVADGTYVLVEATLYTGAGGATGPTGETRQMTMRIRGHEGETVFDGVNRSTTFTTNGTTLHGKSTCPSTSEDDQPYTATSTTLAVEVARSGGRLVLGFEKR